MMRATADAIFSEPGPTPTAVSSPEGDPASPNKSEADEQLVPPGSNRAWLVPGPDFSNRVLHWTSSGHRMSRDEAGQTKRETIYGEFWVEIDSGGVIRRSREEFSRADGSMYQEVVYDSGEMVTVWSSSTLQPSQNESCVIRGMSAPPNSPFPEFAADPVTLVKLGFKETRAALPEVHQTLSLSSIQPVTAYPSDALATWEREETTGVGIRIVRQLAVGDSNRLILAAIQELTSDGALFAESQVVLGTLEVYEPRLVPDAVFAFVNAGLEECNG